MVGVAGSNPVFRLCQFIKDYAGVAELADAQDLKSCGIVNPSFLNPVIRPVNVSPNGTSIT